MEFRVERSLLGSTGVRGFESSGPEHWGLGPWAPSTVLALIIPVYDPAVVILGGGAVTGWYRISTVPE